jgi:hypothetical protein
MCFAQGAEQVASAAPQIPHGLVSLRANAAPDRGRPNASIRVGRSDGGQASASQGPTGSDPEGRR